MDIKLRPYQEEDVKKLLTKEKTACFNEQRTGKTPTAIMTMERRNVNRLIIVCPNSAIPIWANEYKTWTGKNATMIQGSTKEKEKLVNSWENNAIIVSYDSFKTTSSRDGLVYMLLSRLPDGIIFDEAHRMKNRKSKNFLAAKLCNKIKYTLLLTGTPVTKADDIWSLLHLLNPTEFKSYWKFVDEFLETQKRWVGRTQITEIVGVKPSAKPKLLKILNEYSTNRKRKDVMRWLPDKTKINIRLKGTASQYKHLNNLKEFWETGEIITKGVLDRLIRYRQICLDPRILNLKGNSVKTEWILNYCLEYPEVPKIIFTKFTTYIKLLTADLKKNKIPFASITGATKIDKRKQYVKDFQDGKYNTLILNIDAGKEALTVDRAEVTIFMDKYPPVTDIQQAEDRFIATTEAKANKDHLIYNLILKDSYDEEIIRMLEEGASETDVINNYKKYIGM